ncbi:cytochrome P450 [Mycolicibacterium sp. lyk4-40-TYG-92]|uniref:cytochrome P450 n=1 Tax=Mycolicibacterium sp. lyk4-40-TYG-92 TaxID=3040295 RepID=UPI00254E665E|nr:cytochrome P450 [Mycolicibacterium sp. lyk4-40-TYG-92]
MTATAVTFTPGSAATWRGPWAMYAALREHDPVHHVIPEHAPDKDYWVLSRYADISAAAKDHGTFSSADGLTFNYDDMEAVGIKDNPPMVMQDPPVHTTFRRLVAKGFTPRQVTAVEPKVREFVIDRIEKLRAKGTGDIITEFLKPLPSMVVAHYLGVPEQDWDRFDAWTDAIVAANATGHQASAGPAVAEIFGYFNELIAYRQKNPGDDTVSHLVEAGFGADGDMSGILSILGFAFTMITGGNDTTTGMLGGAVQLLSARRDQRQLLIDDPALIPDAVEELLRLTSPVQGLARMTTRDVEIEGTTIPAGRKTFLLYGSGNRDHRQFGPDAEELNVLRRPAQILTFSHGNHHCLGAAAARMQARIALEELLTRCPDFDVDADAVEYAEGSYVRRPTHLPFTAQP